MKFSPSEWIILALVGSVHLCNAICVSLQAPFYPEEAEKKGCSATEYGFVFGSFELVAFITAPIFGSLVQKLGVKFMLISGVILNSASLIAFGCLTYINNKDLFLLFSLCLRVLGALGATGSMVAAFSLTAISFPNSIASTFASLEVFYGLGYIIGPTLGAVLFELGGFLFPFLVTGVVTFGMSLVVLVVMKQDVPNPTKTTTKVIHFMRIPVVFVNSIATMISASAMGFFSATLEPHIREFGLSSIQVGFVFIIYGGTYALISPFIGQICDAGFDPKKMVILGTILTAISFSIVGPAPFVPLNKSMMLIIIGLVIYGVALGMICVPTLIDSMKASFEKGFPNDIHTYGILSGIWSSSFSLGAFVGPSAAGVLYDFVGFQKGTYFEIILNLAMALVMMIFVCKERKPTNKPVIGPIPVITINIEHCDTEQNACNGASPMPVV